MKETIYTIPINEAFDFYDICPMCRLKNDLEAASVEFIMGAAMMEPVVRIKTNEQGFCRHHLNAMLIEKNKLALALMLESHLPELNDSLFACSGELAKNKPAGRLSCRKASVRRGMQKLLGAARGIEHSCYICNRIDDLMKHYYDNLMYMWKKEPEFRDKFMRQKFFCLPHYTDLLEHSARCLPGKYKLDFVAELSRICQSHLSVLKNEILEFCKSFDYRFAGRGLSDGAIASVEQAADFLTGQWPP